MVVCGDKSVLQFVILYFLLVGWLSLVPWLPVVVLLTVDGLHRALYTVMEMGWYHSVCHMVKGDLMVSRP